MKILYNFLLEGGKVENTIHHSNTSLITSWELLTEPDEDSEFDRSFSSSTLTAALSDKKLETELTESFDWSILWK